MPIEDHAFIAITAQIVAAHVSHNQVPVNDVADLIHHVHGALTALGSTGEPELKAVKPAVSLKASVKPEYLVSMIDGKKYKMLRRHLTLNGYTPESYREAFNLPKDYPMTSSEYAARRSAMAKAIGLGRKPKAAVSAESAEPVRGRRTNAEQPDAR